MNRTEGQHPGRIYFDNAATTPVHPEVIRVMSEALAGNFGNPSSIHAEGRAARAAIEQARKTVARCLNASVGEIFFTSGGTESNNMALKCAVRDLGVRRIISSPLEHHCVLHSLESLEKYQQIRVDRLQPDALGRFDTGQLRALLAADSAPTLVSLMYANNEIGTMIDLDEVAEICAEAGAWFHSDTVQTIGYFPIDLAKTRVSFLSGSAHKFHGPKGVGFVYISGDNQIRPFIDGGSQERNMRAGTENLPSILGMAKALELAYAEMDARRDAILDIRDYFLGELTDRFEGISVNGDCENGHYKILSVEFPSSPKTDLLLFNLDIAGISVSGGSACSSGADAGSHVIAGIKPDSPGKTVRFSFSHFNTRAEADAVVEKLSEILKAKKAVG